VCIYTYYVCVCVCVYVCTNTHTHTNSEGKVLAGAGGWEAETRGGGRDGVARIGIKGSGFGYRF
jgi:hypothetical protein